jgi:rhodanese-related sulfurtransferase
VNGLATRLAAGLVAIGVAAACVGGKRPVGYVVLTARQVEQQLAAHEALVIVDVREPSEFAARHIPGARLIPYEQAAGRVLKELNKGDHIVFVCHTGPMGDELARLLVANGYLHVANLGGGMSGWTGPTVSAS